jgi:hypothetical protein
MSEDIPRDRRPGAPSVARRRGDLRPVYRQLQLRMPGHPACQSWKALAFAIARVLQPTTRTTTAVSGLQRDLGGETIDGVQFVKVKYFEAFKCALGLEELGITDAILFEPDLQLQNAAIDAALARNPFALLLSQTDVTGPAAIEMARGRDCFVVARLEYNVVD